LSELTGRSKTYYLIEAIQEHMDDLEKVHLVKQGLLENRAERSKRSPLEEGKRSQHSEAEVDLEVDLDLPGALAKGPQELDFVWPGFLAGTVGALVAPGGTGKSFFALQAVIALACSETGGDLLELAPPRCGKVVYLAAEDPEPILAGRAYAIGQHLSKAARATLAANLRIKPILGKRVNLMDEGPLRRVIETCRGNRLIVLDTLSRLHQLDENSNGDMAALMSVLEYMAAQTGSAVLYLHHVSKGSAREGKVDQPQAARGASALVDNVRWCGYLASMSEAEAEHLSDQKRGRAPIGERRSSFVRFGVSKQSYGAHPPDRWYQRQEEGLLLPVELYDVTHGNHKKGRGRDEL